MIDRYIPGAAVVVTEKEPETEDGLGKNVKDGIGDDLSIDGGGTGTISEAPDTVDTLVCALKHHALGA
jgi:hypothetical protein